MVKTDIVHSSCPTSIVNASVEIVWGLLTRPEKWGDFYDVRITSVEPAGPAVVGQTVLAESGPRLLHLALEFRFTKIDAVKYELGLDVKLPFGVTVPRRRELHPNRTGRVPRQLPLWLRLSDGMARYGRAHAHASRAQLRSG
jgi:hypothetical protein